MTAKSITRRRLPSFSLRTLLVASTVFGVWFGLHVRSVKQQRTSVEAIKSLGGYVRYDCVIYRAPTRWEVIRHLLGSQWLLSKLGHDHFHSVIEVSDQHHSLHSKEILHHLSGLPHLQVLELYRTPADDESLRSIGELTKLRKLKLGRADDVTDEGGSYLSQLQGLEHLEMNYSRLSDKSVETVSDLQNLEVLQLEGEFSEEAIRHLRHLKNLQKLTLVGLRSTELSEVGVIAVKDLTALKELNLWHARVTQKGLWHRKRLQNFRRLNMR